MPNYARLILRSALRTLVLSCKYPRAALAAGLQKIFRWGPVSASLKNADDRHRLKALAKESAKPTGWASSGRELEVSVFGTRLFRVSLAEGEEANAQQFYFSRSLKDFKSALAVFSSHGKTIPMREGALIFEPGCNAGRYLFYLSDRHGCRVLGADVYAPAVNIANRAAIYSGEQFIVADLVGGKTLEAFADHHFDMVFLSSHLAHVVHLPGGVTSYLRRLMRIAKTVVFIEKYKNETAVAARELGFWTLPWQGSLLGHFCHEDLPKSES